MEYNKGDSCRFLDRELTCEEVLAHLRKEAIEKSYLPRNIAENYGVRYDFEKRKVIVSKRRS